MSILNKKEHVILVLGDVVLFLVSLWVTLIIRYGYSLNHQIFYAHLAPFTLLGVVWIMVFFIAGLYEKHTLLFRRKLPHILLNAVLANSFLAIIFFYFIPYFGISPKVNLFVKVQDCHSTFQSFPHQYHN
jgi:FlaA1/EpsC-like NDP-sugar epimerase